jgi:Fic-DOC domain mobile mystery protein B
MTVVMEYPEGATPLDPDEMEGLRYRHITTRGELDELEQVNIQSGLLWLRRQRRREILTDDFVVTLHKQLFGEVWAWAGSFRRTEKNIGIDPLQISVELRTLMDDATYWTKHGTYDPVEAAVRLHHRMVFIHPFPNGNGRHARIMADTVLDRIYDAHPIDWSGGHDLQKMNDRRAAYIAALRAADKGDIGPLLAFAGALGGGS